MVIMAKKVSAAAREAPASLNVAEAKRRLSELLGRVAYGGATVVITRRGTPMAKLVPPDSPGASPHLADVRGWLDEADAFFSEVEDIVAARSKHPPRTLRRPPRRHGRGAQ